MNPLRLVMKNRGAWYVIERTNFPELMDILEDDHIPGANYGIKHKDAIFYIKSQSCIVIHFEEKKIYLHGINTFKVPPAWTLVKDVTEILDPEDWAWQKQRHKRGYTFVSFRDVDGKECHLEESQERNGIYLGVREHGMHLTKAMVEKLIPLLERFTQTGGLE